MPKALISHSSMLDIHHNLTTTFSSDVRAERVGTTWHVECDFQKLQPQEMARLQDDLYIASAYSGALLLDGKLFADNLSRPVPIQLTIDFTVAEITVNLEEIREL